LPYWVDQKWHVLRKVDAIKETPKEQLTLEHQEIVILVKKYLDTGKLSEAEFLKLKTHAVKESMHGDNRLLELTNAIERKEAQLDYREFNSLIGTPQAVKVDKWLNSMSKIDAFSVTIVLALIIVAVGVVYPKLQGLLKRSNRAAFLFLLTGLGSILWILR